MNIKNKAVELRNSKFTTDPGALQKGEDFVKALALGFDVDDAIALLRLDDLYVYSYGPFFSFLFFFTFPSCNRVVLLGIYILTDGIQVH